MDVVLLWSYWLKGSIHEPQRTVGMMSWVRGYRAVGVKRVSYSVRSLEKPMSKKGKRNGHMQVKENTGD